MSAQNDAANAAGLAAINVRAVAPTSWGTGSDSAAVGEIVPKPGKRSTQVERKTFSIGINSAPQHITVAPGDYTVRLFLPNGEIMAESVSLATNGLAEVTFELRASPHEWLSAESVYGAIQVLPSAARARALESVRSAPENAVARIAGYRPTTSVRERIAQAVIDTDKGASAVEEISGLGRVPSISGSRLLTRIDLDRALPESRIRLPELVRWWTGEPESPPVPLQITHHDERNAKLIAPPAASVDASDFLSGKRRAFAKVQDPTGAEHFAVYPEAWVRTSRSSLGTYATASALMTVVVDSVLHAQEETGYRARWRCSTSTDDIEAMAFLGFLASGQTSAARILLRQAQEFLFEKRDNPIAAAAGALALLTYSEETNARERPRWREWIRKLYSLFPRLPDSAIAMAKMYLKFGDNASAEEIDVEKLRGYALQSVRCGLPYLSFSVNALSEIMLMLVRDDEAEKRSGTQIEETRRAYALVHQLTRIMDPGEFFTVLRLADPRA
jgi:hypothetical protein